MSKRNLILIIVLLAMTALVVLFFMLKDKQYAWYETLQPDGDQPYDLAIFKELLQNNAYGGDFEEVSTSISASVKDLNDDESYNYFAIRSYFFPDTGELRTLLKFINEGNTLFLSANGITPFFPIAAQFGMDSIYKLQLHLFSDNMYDVADSVLAIYQEVSWSQQDSVHQLYKQALRAKVEANSLLDSAIHSDEIRLTIQKSATEIPLYYLRNEDTLFHQWNGVRLPPPTHNKRLVTFKNGTPALVKWRIGKGAVFISSTPLLFTNINLVKKENFSFCNELLAELPQNSILYDEVVRFNFNAFAPKASLGKSPLSFILSQRPLKWAWFTLLGTILLFVVYRSKRKQRIIPILKPNTNTTLAYAKMLGSLQFKEKNNKAKAQEITQHFIQHLRVRNRWQSSEINKELKEMLIKLIPELEKEIQLTVHLASKAHKNELLTDQQLIKLFNYTHQIIEKT